MSKIHYFQRYSSVENTVTNNTLQLLARIYDYSTSRASKLLTDITGESIEIGIEINQQGRASSSVPDGAILQRSFKILVESKVDSGVNGDQLLRHAISFSNESQQILLLLTKQKIDSTHEQKLTENIKKNSPRVVFKNITYETICSALHDLFADYENEMKSLTDDYIEYCNDECLFDQSKYLMRIVPCGESLEINQKYGVYFHPTDRGYTKHQFVGIYKDKAVQTLWDIDSVYDIDYDGNSLAKTLVQGRETTDYDDNIIAIIQDAKNKCGYEISTGHRFFCGKPINTKYVKSSPGGIQGARFVNLKEVIGDFVSTQEIADKLRDEKWI
jgi:hypothetical protein